MGKIHADFKNNLLSVRWSKKFNTYVLGLIHQIDSHPPSYIPTYIFYMTEIQRNKHFEHHLKSHEIKFIGIIINSMHTYIVAY